MEDISRIRAGSMLGLKAALFGMSTVAARALNLFPGEALSHLLLFGAAALVGEYVGRANLVPLWRRLKSRPRPVMMSQAVTVVFAVVYLLDMAAAILLALFGLIMDESARTTHPWLAKAQEQQGSITLIGLVASLLLIVAVWRSRAAKIKMLDDICDSISEATEALASIDEADDIEAVKRLGTHAIEKLLDPMIQPRGIFSGRTNGLRTGFVFIPSPDGRFDIAVMWPAHPQYAELPERLRPAIWRPAEVAQLREELMDARQSLKAEAFERKELEIKIRLEKCASITGFTYRYPRLHIYPDVRDCYFRTEEYLKAFPPENQTALAIRSKAAIGLQCGSKTVGVLVLTDTAVGGYMNSDKSRIEILAPCTAMIVDRVLTRIGELEQKEGRRNV